MGGTLSKVAVCLDTTKPKAQAIEKFFMASDKIGKTGQRDQFCDFTLEGKTRVLFIRYNTARMKQAFAISKKNGLVSAGDAMGCTGGGAVKYNPLFQKNLKLGKWAEVDEMKSLVQGIAFLIENVKGSIFKYTAVGEDQTPSRCYLNVSDPNAGYPRLLVNVGSGVSILFLESPRKYRRVGGSSCGGATFLGLARLVAEDPELKFSEAIEKASIGDSKHVDLLVKDIYGGHYTKLGLRSDVIAAYFGKLARSSHKNVRKEDRLAALLKLVTYNIGITAWLYARIYRPLSVVFVGNFLRGNNLARHRISYMVQNLSKANADLDITALFMEREGYFGALGALLNAEVVKGS